MARGIKFFLLLMIAAATSRAGEKNVDFSHLSNDLSDQQKTGIVLPVVNEKYEYYEVCGRCEKDIQCELQQKCIKQNDGKKYDSVTNWKVKWDYGYSHTPQTCRADSFTVTVEIVYHLPKWVRTGDAPRPLVEKWDSYLEKLMTHEKGHRDKAVEAATELIRSVADLPAARTCAELDRAVHDLSRERMAKLLEEQQKYDAATNHGAAQGAVFP